MSPTGILPEILVFKEGFGGDRPDVLVILPAPGVGHFGSCQDDTVSPFAEFVPQVSGRRVYRKDLEPGFLRENRDFKRTGRYLYAER